VSPARVTVTLVREVLPRDADDEGGELVLTVACEVYPYVPAYTSGPPEDCYEAEGGVDIDSATDPDGREVDLSDAEIERVIELAHEAAATDAEDCAAIAAEHRAELAREMRRWA